MKPLTMQLYSIIFFFKIIIFVKLIQCEINTTINLFLPSILNQAYQNLPLTEQVIYDLKNTMRKSNEIIDFDDEEEDYLEYDQIEIDNQLITSIQSTTSNIEFNTLKSSSSSTFCFLSKNLFIIIFIIKFKQITDNYINVLSDNYRKRSNMD